MDNLDFVRNIFLFSGLSRAERDALVKVGRLRSYSRKKIIFRQGDPALYFCVICSGAVRLFHETPDGREVTSHIRTAGDTIGITGIFSPDSLRHFNVMALSNTTTLEFSAEWLKETARQYSVISANLLSVFAQQAHKLEVEVENQTTMSAVQRVACFLKRTCAVYGLDPKGFKLPYSKALVASRLGLMQETLSRTFPKLKEIGITVKNRQVSFHDMTAMERNVCAHCCAAEVCKDDCSGQCFGLYKCGVQTNALQFSIA